MRSKEGRYTAELLEIRPTCMQGRRVRLLRGGSPRSLGVLIKPAIEHAWWSEEDSLKVAIVSRSRLLDGGPLGLGISLASFGETQELGKKLDRLLSSLSCLPGQDLIRWDES